MDPNPGGWWCCCGSCGVFADDFDRPQSTELGCQWDECPSETQGDWWIRPSTRPQYDHDSALYEMSGAGLVLSAIREPTASQFVRYQTIDEYFGNRYQIWLRVTETNPKSCHAGDALMVEFYIGNGTTIPHSLTAYRVSGGMRTTLATKTFNRGAPDVRFGRQFFAEYIAPDQLLCAGVTQVTGDRANLWVQGVADPGGRRVGIGNGSDSSLPIEVDDFIWLRLVNPRAVLPDNPICFACLCKCMLYDSYGSLRDVSLFPPTLYLRIQGSCCGTTIDVTVPLLWTQDYPSTGMDSWKGTATFCGADFVFRLECAKGVPPHPQLFVCVGGYPGCWSDDTGPPDGPIALQPGATCSPISLVYIQNIGSLNTHPCCGGCTSGSFTYTITS